MPQAAGLTGGPLSLLLLFGRFGVVDLSEPNVDFVGSITPMNRAIHGLEKG